MCQGKQCNLINMYRGELNDIIHCERDFQGTLIGRDVMHYVEATQTKVGLVNAVVTEGCYFDISLFKYCPATFKYCRVNLVTSLTGFPYLPSRSLFSSNRMK